MIGSIKWSNRRHAEDRFFRQDERQEAYDQHVLREEELSAKMFSPAMLEELLRTKVRNEHTIRMIGIPP